MEEIVFRYIAEKNPQGAALPGVPLRDLTAADVAAVPTWLQPSIAAQPFYQVAEAATTKRPARAGA